MSDLPKKLYHGAGHKLDCVAPIYTSELREVAIEKGCFEAVRYAFGDRFKFASTISHVLVEATEPVEGVTIEKILRLEMILYEIPVGHEPGVVWEPVPNVAPGWKCWMTHNRLSIFSDKRTLRFCDIHRGKELTLILSDGTSKTKVL